MAKKKGRGRRRRYLKGNVDEDLIISSSAKIVTSGLFDETVNERTLISSIVATYSLENFTSGPGDGPMVVGIAHGDYSGTEIEETLESTDSWKEGDKVAQEIARRQIRTIGVFDDKDGAATVHLNDGKPIKTKLNWILTTGQTLRLWVYNSGSSALSTVPVAHCQGHVNLWPQ